MNYYKLEIYLNDEGKEIRVLKGQRPGVIDKKVTQFGIPVPEGELRGGFEFPNEMKIEECFERYDELAQPAIEKALKKYEDEKAKATLLKGVR